MISFRGQAVTAGHFVQPTTSAIGHSVIFDFLPVLRFVSGSFHGRDTTFPSPCPAFTLRLLSLRERERTQLLPRRHVAMVDLRHLHQILQPFLVMTLSREEVMQIFMTPSALSRLYLLAERR